MGITFGFMRTGSPSKTPGPAPALPPRAGAGRRELEIAGLVVLVSVATLVRAVLDVDVLSWLSLLLHRRAKLFSHSVVRDSL